MSPILLIALGLALQTPVITATLSSESVAPGEMFELVIRVETTGANPDIRLGRLPAGLELVQNATGTTTQTGFPGGTTRVVTQSYGLVSRVPGEFVLPAAVVRVNGGEYSSRPLAISVRPPGTAGASSMADPPRLELAVEPSRAWVGQAVLLRADAMFPRDIRSRLTRPAIYEPPAAPGFWVVDLPTPMTLQLQRIGDEVFEVQTYRRVYVPILPGPHVLAPARLTYEIRAGLLQPPRSLLVESDSVRLEVMPLPAEGRPASFAGAVGEYTMRVRVTPTDLAVGEAATVTVEIRGLGDLRAVAAPVLAAPPGVEILPPTEATDEERTGTDIGGRKTFSWTVIPQEPGPVALAPIEFAFFNPESRTYRTLRSDSLHMDVTGFAGSEEGQGLRPADPKPSPPGLGFVRTPAFAIAQTIPLLLLLLGALRARRRTPRRSHRSPAQERVDLAAEVQRIRSSAAQDGPGAVTELATLLRAVLQSTGSGTETGGPTPGTGGTGAEPGLTALLADVDRKRFGDANAPDIASLLNRAERLLGKRGQRGAGKRTFLLVLLLPMTWPPAAQTGSPPAAFRRGVAALEARDAGVARDAFEDYLRARPGDASAWYNLGNAAYRDGDRGAATHAWLQALELDPRRADARHNLLTVVGAASERLYPSRLALNGEAAVLMAALAWWIGVLAILLLRGRHRHIAVLIAAVTVVAAAAGWMIGRAAPDLATVRRDGMALRAEPALQSEAVRPIVAGEPLEILSAGDTWVRVRSAAGDQGWVEITGLDFVFGSASEITAMQ